MKTTTVLMMSALILTGLTAIAGSAAADSENFCNIPFVGGFVDKTCDQAGELALDETCWAIGWWCD